MTRITAAMTACCGASWTLEDADLDEPRDDEVLVRIIATGICHTDASVRDQHLPLPLPAVLGHEGAGVVERVGPAVQDLEPGDHVVLTIANCGRCPSCWSGLPTYCQKGMALNFSGRRLDGSPTLRVAGEAVSGSFFGQSSFATYALASERNAVKVDRHVPLDLLGPLGCGVQTGAGTVINTLKPKFGSSLVVFGAGTVGLSAVMAARLVGCSKIIAVDIHDQRLDLAREVGATHAIHTHAGQPAAEAVRAALGGHGADYVLDCTGATAVLPEAIACLAPLGRLAIVGVYARGTAAIIDPNSILLGQTVGGAIEGDSIPKLFIPQLIDMWRQGRFPFDKLVTFYPFSEINQAMADALSGQVVKPVLRMPSE